MICLFSACSKPVPDDFSKQKNQSMIVLKHSQKEFTYYTDHFSPQVRSQEDLSILRQIMQAEIEAAKTRNDLPLAANLMAAFQMKDFVRVEFLLYTHEKNKKESKK